MSILMAIEVEEQDGIREVATVLICEGIIG